MTRIVSWQDGGIFPLQDTHEGVACGRRQQLAGARVVKLDDAANGAQIDIGIGTEHGIGTIGDIHPWFFWQTNSRGLRATGSWSQSFAGIVEREFAIGGPTTGEPGDGAAVIPIGGSRFEGDKRYVARGAVSPTGLSRFVRGQLVSVKPNTDEADPWALTFNADGRLWAPSTGGPGECGTLVVDLGPDREACMAGSDIPGVGGRHARLQSIFRVVAFSPGSGGGRISTPGNAIAWNLSTSSQEGQSGLGMCWIKLAEGQASGPTTGGPGGGSNGNTGPITGQPGGSFGWTNQVTLEDGAEGLASENLGKRPKDFGTFIPKPSEGSGIALMAHLGAFGPFHGGCRGDKHKIGNDRDGNPINSGHLSINAYWYKDPDKDGPFLFEGLYPNPAPLPLQSRVHLTWDQFTDHQWLEGTREGVWRWWAEVPVVTPAGGSPPVPNRGPTTGGGGRPIPGGPGVPTPGGPPTPGPVPPWRGPLPPGGPGGPGGRSSPPLPGGPAGPAGPGSTGGGQPGSTGGGPVTPGGGREPTGGEPGTTGGPVDEIPDPLPPTWATQKETIPAWGEPPTPQQPPMNTGRVGEASGTRSLFSIHHPFAESFQAISIRPQPWVAGRPNSEHNQFADPDYLRDAEQSQPQVLALRSWGAQAEGGGWGYTENPTTSRARGGTANGGLLFCPPQYEPEDYLGIGDVLDVDAPTTQSYVTAAPGVAFALGKPHYDGGLVAGSVIIGQVSGGGGGASPVAIAQTDPNREPVQLLVAQYDPEANERSVVFPGTTAVTLPVGTTAQRPSTPVIGQVRVNTEVEFRPEAYDPNVADWKRIDRAIVHIVEGSAVGKVETVPLSVGGGAPLSTGSVGVPVTTLMTAESVAVSWRADEPMDAWTIRLWRRTPTGTFYEAATMGLG